MVGATGFEPTTFWSRSREIFRVPTLTKTGSATTFFADYANLVSSNAVRAVRRRGYVSYGAYAGPRYVNAYYAPSNGSWPYGAALYMTQ